MELRAMPWHESIIEAELAKAKVLVNATSVGLAGDETPVPGELIPPGLLVMDLVYNPPRSRLLREAEAAGCEVMNGELMLLHQARRVHPVDRPAAPIGLMHEKLSQSLAATGAAVGGAADEGAGTAASRAPDGGHDQLPVPDRGRVARAVARRHAGGPPGGIPVTADAIATDCGAARGLRPRRAPGDRAGPGRDPGGRAQGERSGRPCSSSSATETGRAGPGHAGRAAEHRDAAELAALAEEGNRRAQGSPASAPATPTWPRPQVRFEDVRPVLERASARETAAGSRRGPSAGLPGRAGIEAWSFTAEVAAGDRPRRLQPARDEAEASPLRCPTPAPRRG